MTKYFKNKLTISLSLLVFASSCVDINDNIGSNVVPDIDKYKLVIDTVSSGFEMRSVQNDSMVSNTNLKDYYLGSTILPRQGRIDASFVTQVLPAKYPEDGTFPKDCVVDSAFMVIYSSGYVGLDGYTSELSVYELTKPFPHTPDSTKYYSNFPIEKYIPSVATYSKQIRSGYGDMFLRLDPSTVEKYLGATEKEYTTDSLFIKKFPGYYFKTSQAFSNGAMYKIIPNNDKITSGIKIHYHTLDEPTEDKTFTLSFAHFVLNPETGGDEIFCEGFNLFDRDYTYADPSFDFDPSSTEKSYVMGLDGISASITVPKDYIEEIQAKIKGSEGGIIALSRAELIVPIGDKSVSGMDHAVQRAGLYYDYQGVDYMPSYWPNYNTESFGGELNRAKYNYSMDVTSYIQELIGGKSDEFTIQLAPAYATSYTFDITEVVNTPEDPIKLVITYLTNIK